jgi:Methyltransferase domain
MQNSASNGFREPSASNPSSTFPDQYEQTCNFVGDVFVGFYPAYGYPDPPRPTSSSFYSRHRQPCIRILAAMSRRPRRDVGSRHQLAVDSQVRSPPLSLWSRVKWRRVDRVIINGSLMAALWSSRLLTACQILASQGVGGILEEVRARLLYRLAHTGGGISYYEFRMRDWDRSRRVETSGLIHQKDLDYVSTSRDHALDYLGTDLWSFRAVVSILRRLGVRPAESALVDYGCGKGRVLLMAIEAGFRKTIGVEIVPDLAQAAVDNLRSYRARRTASVHCGDATTFPVPAGPLVAFLFNPFTGPVLEAVAENIRRSFEEQPRAMYVVYLRPQADCRFRRGAPFTLVESATNREIYRLEA